jgi:flagellar assembly protein FliH
MSNTLSRVLSKEESALVEPVWWRSNDSVAAPVKSPLAGPADERQPHADDAATSADERQAYQRGFSEGKAVGSEQANAEAQAMLGRLTRSLAEISTLRARARKDAESDLLKLSIAIARRVLHRELTIDPDSIGGLIRVALEKLESRELYRVRTHPAQEDAVRNSLARFAEARQVEVVPDASLQCGDVLFETPLGTLDASIEMQLREVERGFADRMRR